MRIVIVLIWLVLVSTMLGQAPIQRNTWTTNSNPVFKGNSNVVYSNINSTVTYEFYGDPLSNSNRVVRSGDVNLLSTNGVAVAVDANGVGVTTNFTGGKTVYGVRSTHWTNQGGLLSLAEMPETIKVYTNGVISALQTGTNRQAQITNGGFAGQYSISSTNSMALVQVGGGLSLGYFYDDGDPSFGNTNASVTSRQAGRASGQFIGTLDCTVTSQGAGLAGAEYMLCNNVDVLGDEGGWSGWYVENSINGTLRADDGSLASGQMIDAHTFSLTSDNGSFNFVGSRQSSNVVSVAVDGGMSFHRMFQATNVITDSRNGSFLGGYIEGTNITRLASFGTALGITRSNERLMAVGEAAGVEAFAFGRDVVSTNNWLFGLHDTNSVPLSFRVGYNGVRALQVESNLNTTVHALKVGLVNQGTLTNVLYGSATLNFGSTSSGAIEDLAITVTGAADGDIVSVGPPVTACTGIIGSYSGFASNDTVFVRFTPTAATQNPNSGTFKVMVHKFQ